MPIHLSARRLLAGNAVSSPGNGPQALNGNRFLARQTRPVIAGIQTIQGLVHKPELQVIDAIQVEGHEFIVRNLGLVLFGYAAHPGKSIELYAKRSQHIGALFNQLFAVRRVARRMGCCLSFAAGGYVCGCLLLHEFSVPIHPGTLNSQKNVTKFSADDNATFG